MTHDERREEYAAELWESSDSYCPYENGPWSTDKVPAADRAEFRRIADAATAKADEETRSYRRSAEHLFHTNGRLRIELRNAHENLESAQAEIREQDDEIERLNKVLTHTKTDCSRLDNEIDRLRGELEELREALDYSAGRADNLESEIRRLQNGNGE